MKIKILLFISFFVTGFAISCNAQYEDTLIVAFWNLQNLFDTKDNPAKEDESFLPNGEMQWTEDRLDKKMFNLSRVIRMMNDGNGPDLLGVCEVENQAVLEEMVKKYLSDLDYKVAYLESPDNRG
ncbi:MAG: endonuclease/exonuclease/phosphatase family protein, partial [Ignavibacteriaceae bacterium]|nr:endonuclease/exonuclease/phosphatase family protein [Ignavibacteriaceae bacterium]